MTIYKRASFVLAAFLVIGAGAFLAPATAQNSDPTVQQCSDAWGNSSASQSCGLNQVHDNLASISVSGGQCSVSVDCSTSTYGVHRNTSFTGSVNEMGRLHNCNGNLKLDGC